ncbi:transcription initiation factor TFIID subunit 4-like [Trachypithecus francoisi]|uniref:transcription initiation factor TFIID subunit 4-like n=1 Tax=Trachypithecus francoisi TaxID=54180 RepID=UPI00141AA3F7|nr:transcription initiation factor TFIID subunit 4-like [Trachypithecus francoisi]
MDPSYTTGLRTFPTFITRLTSCEKLNITYILSAGIYFCSHKAFLLRTEQALLPRTPLAPPQPPFQRPKSDFRNRNRNGHGPPERQVGALPGRSRVRRRCPAGRGAGEARSLHNGSPEPPVAAAARRSATARRPPWPSEVPTGRAPGPSCGFAPRPERARGAGPRGLGGRSAGRARGGARGPPGAPGNLGARHCRRRATFLSRLLRADARRAACQGLTAAAALRRGEAPRRAPAAGRPARGTAGPRAGAALPPPRPRPQRAAAAAARWRLSPRARRFPVGKVARRLRRGRRAVPRPSAAAAPPGRRAGRPSRRPRFFTCREFSRARSLDRSLFPLSRSFSFFLSFFSLTRAGAFSSRVARVRPLAPSFLLGSAERGGRQLSPPPSTRAPAEAAAALRAPTHSNMARMQGACARAPPPPAPRSSRQPAPLAPRPWSPGARLPRSLPSAIPPDWGHAGGKDYAGWCAGGPAPRATHAPSQQLGADGSEAVAQDTRRRLGPPTAPWRRGPELNGPEEETLPREPSARLGLAPTQEGRAPAPHLGLWTERWGSQRGSRVGPGVLARRRAPLSPARDRFGQDGKSGEAAGSQMRACCRRGGCARLPAPRRGSGAPSET